MKDLGPVPIEGFNPKFKSLSEEGSNIFALSVLSELQIKKDGRDLMAMPIDMDAPDTPLYIKILMKRVEAMKLPIKFTPAALIAIGTLVNNVGDVVALLIDCLNKFQGQTIDVEKLSKLYPTGFYDEESFTTYVDDYLKPRKTSWAKIY